jgi:hypothetical protein
VVIVHVTSALGHYALLLHRVTRTTLSLTPELPRNAFPFEDIVTQLSQELEFTSQYNSANDTKVMHLMSSKSDIFNVVFYSQLTIQNGVLAQRWAILMPMGADSGYH